MTRSQLRADLINALQAATGLKCYRYESRNRDGGPHLTVFFVDDGAANSSDRELAALMRVQVDVWHVHFDDAEAAYELTQPALEALGLRRIRTLEAFADGSWWRVSTDWEYVRQP